MPSESELASLITDALPQLLALAESCRNFSQSSVVWPSGHPLNATYASPEVTEAAASLAISLHAIESADCPSTAA